MRFRSKQGIVLYTQARAYLLQDHFQQGFDDFLFLLVQTSLQLTHAQ